MRGNILKRALVCVLSAGMVLSLGGMSAMANETDDAGVKTLAAGTALSSAGGELESGEYYLDTDVTLTEDITIPEGADVTIDLNGHALKGTGSASVITNYGTFTLNDSSGNDSGELTGPTSEEDGVEYGGGVFNSCDFTMNGGKICNNVVSDLGGGICNGVDPDTTEYSNILTHITFTMTGGEICDNTANIGGGVCNGFGEIYDDYITHNMTGGKISGNTASYGGGLCNYGSYYSYIVFTMTGGEISDNTAMNGAGIFSDVSEITMDGGKICNNKATGNGGGIDIQGWGDSIELTLTGGEISENSAGNNGGGVCYGGALSDNSEIFMYGGKISGNTASYGGGLYCTCEEIKITGGEITDNMATSDAGGIYYERGDSLIYIEGMVVINGNTVEGEDNNFSLAEYSHIIRLTGALTEGSSIGITTETKPTTDNPVQITKAESDTEYYKSAAQYFFSDDDKYNVQANDSEHYLELACNESGGSEAFAVYSADDTSLSFYTDDTVPTEGNTYNGKTVTEVYKDVDSSEATDAGDIPWWYNYENITSVLVDSSFKNAKPISLAYWFRDIGNCTAIDGLENIDTSNVVCMDEMFENCTNLTSLDLSGWDTSNVTSMADLFHSCTGLTELDVSGWDTSSVTNMNGMFYMCYSLDSLDVSGFDTSKVTDMGGMFHDCGLTELDVSGFDTSKVTDINGMFQSCSVNTLDVSGWDTSNVVDMRNTFYMCTCLTELDVSRWDTSRVINMSETFYYCSGLTELDVSGWNTSNVRYMDATFCYCDSLTALDLSGWNTSSVRSSDRFAIGCTSLQHIVLGEKTDIFTKGQLVGQKTWYDSTKNGKVASSNYLQDAKYPGEYWTYTETTSNPNPSGDKINGLHKDSDGKWRYYVDGVFTKYTGFARNSNGDWYVENGLVNFDKNGVYKDTTSAIGKKGTWYYVLRNKVQYKFTGLANYKNKSGWWYIKDGKVDFTHNGVDKNKNGWYYITGGKVRFNFTGLANYKNSNGWWYIKGGKVDFTHNGVDKNKNGWYYVEKGKVRFNYTGVSNYKNKNGWWYIKGGKVDFTFNGRAENKNGTWNVVNGKVVF